MSGLNISRSVKSSISSVRQKTARTAALQDIQPVSSRHVSLRDMVLTPARVPPFIIPPLCAVRGSEPRGVGSRRYTLPASAASPRPNRAQSRRCFCAVSALSFTDIQQHTSPLSDPTTRAAMSLPHLAKITTPYGFVTLGESPCVRRRESLFFQNHQPESEPAQQCMKTRRESSSQPCDAAAHRCMALQPKNNLSTSCDCSEELKCTHLSRSLPRKGRLKYFLKKRFSA